MARIHISKVHCRDMDDYTGDDHIELRIGSAVCLESGEMVEKRFSAVEVV